MRLSSEISTMLWAILLAPIIAGIPACFIYWMLFPDQQFGTFQERLSSALFYVAIITLAGFYKWILIGALNSMIALYFIPKKKFQIRMAYAILTTPIPTYLATLRSGGISQTINPDILWGALCFTMASAIIVIYLTKDIDLPPQ